MLVNLVGTNIVLYGQSPTADKVSSYERVDSLLRVLHNLPPNRQSDTLIVRLLNALAREYWNRDATQTSEYGVRALNIATSIQDTIGMIDALTSMGVGVFMSERYDAALKHYLRAMLLAEGQHRLRSISLLYKSIAGVYQAQGQLKQALQQNQYARAIDAKINDIRGIANALSNIGEIYMLLGNLDSALVYYQQELVMNKTLGVESLISRSLINIAEVYRRQSLYEKAEDFAQQALTINKRIGNLYTLSYTLTTLAQIYNVRGRSRQALEYAQEAVVVAIRANGKKYLRDALMTLSDVHDSLGAVREAFTAYKAAQTIADSVFNEEHTRRVERLQAQYEAEKKDQHIQLLYKDQERQVLLQNSLLMAVVVVIGVALWLATLYSRNARALIKILHQQEALEHLNQEKTEIMNIAAHDLKNPLTSIGLMAEVLESDGNILQTSQMLQIASAIRASSTQMYELVTLLLNSNAIEQGTLQLVTESIDVEELLHLIVEAYRHRAMQKNITLHCMTYDNEHQQDGPIFVQADAVAFREVIDNLLSNAIKYSPLGTNVYLRIRRHSTLVHVEVADEGPGISGEDRKKLFGKFARLSAKPTGGEHSTGLGLSIVKKLVEAMNGRVWCESELDKGIPGATFVVELPAA
jgi:signal transduction histidine kinase